MIRLRLCTVLIAALAFGSTACSWDFNNPRSDEKDVQIVGDSVFDLSGDIRNVLKGLSGKGYKDRSVSGAKIQAIDNQLAQAEGRSSLRTVIADGGANDILQGSADCDSDPLTQGCLNVLDYISDKMANMLNDMYAGPSDDHVWLGYYNVKGSEAEKNEAIDYAFDNVYPDLFDLSGSGGSNFSGTAPGYGTYYGGSLGAFQVALADPRSSIVSSDIKSDDIHPTYSGSVKLANLIWAVMVDRNMYR